jgi:DNA-binding transcriptional LysR family regulator
VKTELELRHLRVFVTLVEAGAHTRAARVLGVSQSTVSETMSALERTLGTPLFRKAGKGATLTPSGEALLPYAQKILALSGELVAELAKVSTDVSATLVVTAVESLCTYVLPSRLAILRERWPKARLEVIPGACADIRASVAAGKSDLGLVLGAEADGDETAILARGRLVIVCAPTHPLAGSAATAQQLRNYDFYMCDAAGDYHEMLRRHFEAAQFPSPRMQVLGTIEGVKRGILVGGTAVGLLPGHAIADELRDGGLAEIAVTPPFPGLALRSVMRAESMTSPLVEALVESLRDSPLGPP